MALAVKRGQILPFRKIQYGTFEKNSGGEFRLKKVVQVSFRKSEKTNYEELLKEEGISLGPNEVIFLVNRAGNQFYFVQREIEIKSQGKKVGRILPSRKGRISGTTWDPSIIANYADEVGIKLEGSWLKRLEQVYKYLKEENRAVKKSKAK